MPLTTSLFWVFVVCVLLLICAMASLVARRAWIIRQGVCFDLCVNVETEHSAKGWMLGFAVYGSSELLWYRAFSLMPRDPHDLTTLLSWLESSPPGRDVDNVV